MRRLIKKFSADERGVIAPLFASLLGAGFLFIAFALTSDASALYLEKRTLQNAADSTSLAVASYCGLGSTNCQNAVTIQAEAQTIANLNSGDANSNIDSVCGFNPLNPCSTTPPPGCKPVPSNLPRYGRVVLSTKNPDGTLKVKTPFINYLIGNSNSEVQFSSCSQSAWGKANAAEIPVPLAITVCDYLTDGYKLIQEYSEQLPNCPSTIKDVQGITLTPQPTNVINGWAMFTPIGQQLLCLVSRRVIVGDVLETLPPGQESCKDSTISGSASKTFLQSFISANLKKKIFIPVIASTSGAGNGNAQIVTSNAVGFFSFIFLGYDFGSNQKGGCGDTTYRANEPECQNFTAKDFADCSNSNKRGCIWGRFTKGIVPGASVSRDTSFPPVGAQAVELLP